MISGIDPFKLSVGVFLDFIMVSTGSPRGGFSSFVLIAL